MFKKIKEIIEIGIGIITTILAIFGIWSLVKRKKPKPEDDVVKPNEIKPGTTVVKPKEFKNRDNNPVRDKNKIKTKDGKTIETPIPDNKVKETIKNEMEVDHFEPEHENLTDDLLDKIKELKNEKN